MDILKILKENADPAYKDFTEKLIPNIDPQRILGVRMPIIKKLAKKLSKEDFLFDDRINFHEYILLEGFTIAYKKEDLNIKLKKIEDFIKKIDNWAVCDSFVSVLKFTRDNKEIIWSFLEKYFASYKEYELRFALVMSKTYYVDDFYIDKIFEKIERIKSYYYYVKMAIAWTISEFYIAYPEKTLSYLKKTGLDDFTYNKSLQKIRESKRIDSKKRDFIKTMKR